MRIKKPTNHYKLRRIKLERNAIYGK